MYRYNEDEDAYSIPTLERGNEKRYLRLLPQERGNEKANPNPDQPELKRENYE
jgi:hypothetical protein